MIRKDYDKKLKNLDAKIKALDYLREEKEKINAIILDMREDYSVVDEPMKREIEKKAEQALKQLESIVQKLKKL